MVFQLFPVTEQVYNRLHMYSQSLFIHARTYREKEKLTTDHVLESSIKALKLGYTIKV